MMAVQATCIFENGHGILRPYPLSVYRFLAGSETGVHGQRSFLILTLLSDQRLKMEAQYAGSRSLLLRNPNHVPGRQRLPSSTPNTGLDSIAVYVESRFQGAELISAGFHRPRGSFRKGRLLEVTFDRPCKLDDLYRSKFLGITMSRLQASASCALQATVMESKTLIVFPLPMRVGVQVFQPTPYGSVAD